MGTLSHPVVFGKSPGLLGGGSEQPLSQLHVQEGPGFPRDHKGVATEQALPHWPHVPFTGQHPAGQMSQNPPHSGQAVKAVSACALPARHSPGHHEELVNLLVHERVAGLPHLGLQLGLVSAILLACGEGVPRGEAAGAAGGAPRF